MGNDAVERFVQKNSSEIPQLYWYSLTSAVKCKIRIDGTTPLVSIIGTTKFGDFLIIHQGKLIKSSPIPHTNCNKLHVYKVHEYQVCKEFVIATTDNSIACVIDLKSLKVIKHWDNVEEITVFDHHLLGQSQILVKFVGNLVPSILSYHSNWEHIKLINEDQQSEFDVSDVSAALQFQLQNSYQNLSNIECQLSLQKCVLNRCLTNLEDAVSKSSATVNVPSFLCWVSGNDHIDTTILSEERKIVSTPLWQFVERGNWIIGTTITNCEEQELNNVNCLLVSGDETESYKIYYFSKYEDSYTKLEKIPLTIVDNCKLRPKQAVTVVAVTSVPGFQDKTSETGYVLLNYFSVMKNKEIQINLGKIELNFADLSNGLLQLNIKSVDITVVYPSVVACMSILQFQEKFLLETKSSLAMDVLTRVVEQLGIIYLRSFQCYYGSGIYGHIIIYSDMLSSHQLNLRILAKSRRKMQWFLQLFKGALTDDAWLVPNEPCEEMFNQSELLGMISQTLEFISKYECGNSVHEVQETIENVRETDRIRFEFLRRQSMLTNEAQIKSKCYKIPAIEYSKNPYHCWM